VVVGTANTEAIPHNTMRTATIIETHTRGPERTLTTYLR